MPISFTAHNPIKTEVQNEITTTGTNDNFITNTCHYNYNSPDKLSRRSFKYSDMIIRSQIKSKLHFMAVCRKDMFVEKGVFMPAKHKIA